MNKELEVWTEIPQPFIKEDKKKGYMFEDDIGSKTVRIREEELEHQIKAIGVRGEEKA